MARIGKVAYRLELPPSVAVHPVFHISQLKASLGDQVVSPVLPNDLIEFQIPLEILQRRWTAGSHPVQEVLVRWSQMPASWELLDELRCRFPRASAWGQEGGDVSSLSPARPSPSEDEPESSSPGSSSPSRDVEPRSVPSHEAQLSFLRPIVVQHLE
jgi:hypothetical protein